MLSCESEILPFFDSCRLPVPPVLGNSDAFLSWITATAESFSSKLTTGPISAVSLLLLGSLFSSGTEEELLTATSEFPECATLSALGVASSDFFSVCWTSTAVSTTATPPSVLGLVAAFSPLSSVPSLPTSFTSVEATSGSLALASTLVESAVGEGLIFSIFMRSRGGCLLFLSF
uniref:Uncharacterized protein n=1 Tax=Arundo donax TaxID=35708 RepID=A0A0A9F0U6_ARUDO